MFTRPTSAASALLLLVLAACGDKDVSNDDSAIVLPCSTSVPGLILPEGALSGDVPLTLNLSSPEETSASVTVEWSLDGESWTPATVEGSLTDLPVSPEGSPSSVTWDSVADLGYAAVEGLQLKVVATSACGVWPKNIVTDLTVLNEEVIPPTCSITLTTPPNPSDGVITVEYTTTHPDATPVDVRLSFSTDGGSNYTPADLKSGDCDGDGASDGLKGVTTSAEGTPHCLAWDTEARITTDQEVTLKIECLNGGSSTLESEAISDPFTVANDRMPEPGELVVTEVLSDAALTAGQYVELHNRTNHTLNINGVLIEIWNGGRDPETTAARGKHELSVTSGTINVPAKGLSVIAGSDSLTANGCLTVDDSWGTNINLRRVEHIRLSLGGELLSNFSLTQGGFPAEEYGVAVGADPSAWSSASIEDAASWCYQTTAVPICEGVDELDLAVGTPGQTNDGC
ncbi:hypothetical protein L6R49_26835 [Myxococcota bacterium]|nr:hypothetical protein [Myxococcota bacterium]